MSTGLDALRDDDFAPLRGKRVGLVTHSAAIDSRYHSAAELFAERVNLVALFGPEHGLTGEVQDLIPVEGGGEGRPLVHSLYGDTFESLKPTPEMLDGLDVLVIDMVDVGSRYYTFQATMLYCMEACAAVGLPVVVLDRINTIGLYEVEGPTVHPGYESFVGVHTICTRHGMTIGELATLYKAERVPAVDLTVIRCGADRDPDVRTVYLSLFTVPPSPNMPTATTAELYPGLCLIEGTNLSEGRGTTRPFEYVGFPGLSPRRVVERLRAAQLPGVTFLPASFRPTFQKHAGQSCGGCQVVIDDYDDFRPVRTGLEILIAFREMLGDAFRWRTQRYEFVDHIPAIDLLFGSDRERLAIEAGAKWQEIASAWEPEEAAFRLRRKPHLLYPE
jgi:uncharacterized protein YbbC (DUF1343 family)